MTRTLLASTFLAASLSIGAAQAQTINAGGSSLAYPTYTTEFNKYTTANPSILWSYEAVGSGGGQNAFINNNINYFEPVSGTNTIGYAPGTLTYGTIVGTQVDIGASDAYLLSTQLTNPATGSYVNSSVDGPLIQIPTFGVPITMAFNESGVGSSGLTLNDSQICGVLSGKITDWHSLVPSIAAGTTILVTYRSDSSGTTFLTTQHLNTACTSSNSTFPTYPVPITKSFATLWTSATPPQTVPATFTGESGSGGVASHMVATSASFGYLSPDYTAIAPMSPNTTILKTAKVINHLDHTAYSPNVANTEKGLAHAGPASTNAVPPSSLSAAMDPLNWVPAVPNTNKGYPIVGYTTMDVSSCYASTAAGAAVIKFLTNNMSNTNYQTIIKNNGFSPLTNTAAATYVSSITNTFLSNASGYNLNIDNATTCASYTGR